MSFLISYFKYCTVFTSSGLSYCDTGIDGPKCSSLGYGIIAHEEECKLATDKIGIQFGGNETEPNYPKGCYLYYDGLKGISYWNMDTTGNSNTASIPICKNCIGNIWTNTLIF